MGPIGSGAWLGTAAARVGAGAAVGALIGLGCSLVTAPPRRRRRRAGQPLDPLDALVRRIACLVVLGLPAAVAVCWAGLAAAGVGPLVITCSPGGGVTRPDGADLRVSRPRRRAAPRLAVCPDRRRGLRAARGRGHVALPDRGGGRPHGAGSCRDAGPPGAARFPEPPQAGAVICVVTGQSCLTECGVPAGSNTVSH